MADLEAKGRANPVKSIHPQADEIAGLIYTSGTTGPPRFGIEGLPFEPFLRS
jgi:long-subunit acyl-CoA synthetase (AMP-forming)